MTRRNAHQNDSRSGASLSHVRQDSGAGRPVPGPDSRKTPNVTSSYVTLVGRRLSWAALRLRADSRSVRQLADFVGAVGHTAVGRWRTGDGTPARDVQRRVYDRLGIHPDNWRDVAYLPFDGLRFPRAWPLNACDLEVWFSGRRTSDDQQCLASGELHEFDLPSPPTVEFEQRLWATVRAELATLPESVRVLWGFSRPTKTTCEVHPALCDYTDGFACEAIVASSGLESLLAIPAYLTHEQQREFSEALSHYNTPELSTFVKGYNSSCEEPDEARLLALGDGAPQ
jgi:hypothetical protein